ncbi:MAG: hypothetical protein RL605_9 [Actinomycetota bacterium]|jgi:hypothetical protein
MVGLAVVLLAIGVVQLLAGLRAAPITRVLAATTDLAVGVRLTEGNTQWVELPKAIASEYAAEGEGLGLVVALPLRAHQFIARNALNANGSSTADANPRNVLVTLQPSNLPVAGLRSGDLVDVWVNPPAAVGAAGAAGSASASGNGAAPMLAAPAAIVSAVSADTTGFGATARTVDLLIAAEDLPGVLAASMAQRPDIVLVRAATLAAADGLPAAATKQTGARP